MIDVRRPAELRGFPVSVADVGDQIHLCHPLLSFEGDPALYLAHRFDWRNDPEALAIADPDEASTLGTLLPPTHRQPIASGQGLVVAGANFVQATKVAGVELSSSDIRFARVGNSSTPRTSPTRSPACWIGAATPAQYTGLRARLVKEAQATFDEALADAVLQDSRLSDRGDAALLLMRKSGTGRCDDLAIRQLSGARQNREFDLYRRLLIRFALELDTQEEILSERVERHIANLTAATELPVGEYVRLRSDPTRAGILKPGDRNRAGAQMRPVMFHDGRINWFPADQLELVPQQQGPMADRFAEGGFVDLAWLRRTLTRERSAGRLGNLLYSMEATETDFYAHQFKPVLKLLRSPTDALLIADEVGLGKTIEAGLIWTELRARIDANRLLVVCPKTLCEKWRLELRQRFGVDARIVKADELVALLREQRGHARGFAAIASMQSIRPPKGWDTHTDELRSTRGQVSLARILAEAADGVPLIDLLVVDEAHHMRNPSTQTFALGEMLSNIATYRVFLSATPIHLRNRDLHSLLRLVDPATFELKSTLDELINTTEPLLRARELLVNNASPEEVAVGLATVRRHPILADSKALALIDEDIHAGPLSPADRAEIAARIDSVNQMANFLTRTRRREVEDLRVVREPHACILKMGAAERRFYDRITEAVVDHASQIDMNARFLLATPQRMLTSSLAAASAYWIDVAKGAAFAEDAEDGPEDDIEPSATDDGPSLVPKLSAIAAELDMTEQLETQDTKYDALWQELANVAEREHGAKAIVFSTYRPTLRYLHRRLTADGVACEIMHGTVRESRTAILDRFRDAEARVLLSSDVGSEGIDLQFCAIVLNYDLPWNPMRVEQRIGRVDRLGQKKDKVTIINFVHEDTIDAEIYRRLYERLCLISRALGTFESVLGEPVRDMTKKLFDPTLTKEQRAAAVEQTALAIEQRKNAEEQLEEQAGTLLRHGDYIVEHIGKTKRMHRWLDEHDIRAFVKDRLDLSFPGCNIETVVGGKDLCRIALTPDARRGLISYVTQHRLQGGTRLADGDLEQRYRFTSSVAKRYDGRVECISQMHPLFRFAVALDGRDDAARQAQPVAVSVRRHDVEDVNLTLGLYVVAVRCWEVSAGQDSVAGDRRLAYGGARAEDGAAIDAEVSEVLLQSTVAHGQVLTNFANDSRLSAASNTLSEVVLPDLGRRFHAYVERTEAEILDRVAVQKSALTRHRDVKASNLEQRLLEYGLQETLARDAGNAKRTQQLASIANATRGQLRKLNDNIDVRLGLLDQRRQFTPSFSDITCVVVEVRP